MSTRIQRSIQEPIREGLTWEERWRGLERALVTCWEVGRQLREANPDLVQCAEAGDLPILPWTGGVTEEQKKQIKFGSLHYLAAWQGLRNENLDLDVAGERKIICAKTGMHVIFTADPRKYTGEIQPRTRDLECPEGNVLIP